MNRFNAEHPELDGDELDGAAARVVEEKRARSLEARGIDPATGLQIRAMLTMLEADGHITPMGTMQLTRILDQHTRVNE